MQNFEDFEKKENKHNNLFMDYNQLLDQKINERNKNDSLLLNYETPQGFWIYLKKFGIFNRFAN